MLILSKKKKSKNKKKKKKKKQPAIARKTYNIFIIIVTKECV